MIWKWHDDLQGEQSPRFVLCKDTPIDRVPSASLRRLSALLIASCKIPPPVRLCAFLRFNLTESEIWTFPKEHDPNPSINGASSSGRINERPLDHLGRPRTKIHGGIILYTRRKWLDTIPYYHSLRLTDFEVSTAIHYRTLSTSPLTTCPWCSKSNSLGHDEVCLARSRQTVARHDFVARILHSTLKTIDPTAEHEPHSFEGRRRNDIRLQGPSKGTVDFDVEVYTLLGSKATKTTTNRAAGTSLPLHIVRQATRYLEQIERRAIHVRPLTNGRFVPLVFSAGGMMSEATRKEPETWGEKLDANTFQRMKTMVSIALLKARTRSFEAGRPGDMGNALEELSGDS